MTFISENCSVDAIKIDDQTRNISQTRSSLTMPSTIEVYFTKSANSSYYGVVRKDLAFTTYLKNVIPQEWYVSYYSSYPSYLQAAAMADKMYAWYYQVHSVCNYPPYYSDVTDNNVTQNFLYSAYSSLSSTYRLYVDNVMSYVSGLALVRETSGDLFLVQYRANEGTMHSGILNQSGAYTLAQNGYSALQILQYYLGSTPYTTGENVVYVTHS